MREIDVMASNPREPLPASLRKPFAVLVDARDLAWSDNKRIDRVAADLLHAGCRYFVFFGPGSEVIHDRFDDAISDLDFDGDICTTFHEDETIDDVANFFKVIALDGMEQGLLLVENEASWQARIGN